MSDMNVTDIIRDVRITMDMNGTDTQLLDIASPDTLSVNEIIRSNIETAARDVMAAAPSWLLEKGSEIPQYEKIGEGEPQRSAIHFVEKGDLAWGYIKMPSDFFRLIVFKMKGWERAVTEVITDDSPAYPMLKSKYAGVTGNPEDPVVAIATGAEGEQVLEFYSCDNSFDTMEMGRYLPLPKIKGESIAIPDQLYRDVVQRTASLTYLTLGDDAGARRMNGDAVTADAQTAAAEPNT